MVKYSGIIKTIKSKLGLKVIFVFVFLLLALSLVFIVSKEKTEPKGEPQRYTISSNDFPRFTEAYFDPFDFKHGQEQVVLVKVENLNPIDSVSAIVKTDNQTNNFKLKLASGSATKGTWWGSWKIKDSIKHTYRETFVAQSGNDKSQVDLTFK